MRVADAHPEPADESQGERQVSCYVAVMYSRQPLRRLTFSSCVPTARETNGRVDGMKMVVLKG